MGLCPQRRHSVEVSLVLGLAAVSFSLWFLVRGGGVKDIYIFDVDNFFESLLDLLPYCYCFMLFYFFNCVACRILAP